MLIPFILAAETATPSVFTVISPILGVIGAVGILGAASSYFYKGRSDALITLQKEEINVLKDTNARLTELHDKDVIERNEFIAELKRMRTEIKTLRSLITQPKQLNALAKAMSEQHIAVIGKLTDIAENLVSSSNLDSEIKKPKGRK